MTDLRPILAIGLAGYRGMSAAQMSEASKQMTKMAATAGFDFESLFISAELPTDEREQLRSVLRSKPWAVVSIGSGLRLTDDKTRLLEDVVEETLTLVKPTPKLAFPTRPDEMISTFQRLTLSSP